MVYIVGVGGVSQELYIRQHSPWHSSEVRFECEMMYFPGVVLVSATEGLVVVLNLL